jgi:hypothetical protein
LHEHIAAGRLPDGYACDDFAAIHVVGDGVVRAVASREDADAFRVERVDAEVRETALAVEPL